MAGVVTTVVPAGAGVVTTAGVGCTTVVLSLAQPARTPRTAMARMERLLMMAPWSQFDANDLGAVWLHSLFARELTGVPAKYYVRQYR